MAARKVVRRISQLIVLVSLTLPTGAQSLEVFGYAGVLGEWELTAKVTEKNSSGTKEFSGPFIMSYVGICTVDGPEERTGEIRLRISENSHACNAIGRRRRMSLPRTTIRFLFRRDELSRSAGNPAQAVGEIARGDTVVSRQQIVINQLDRGQGIEDIQPPPARRSCRTPRRGASIQHSVRSHGNGRLSRRRHTNLECQLHYATHERECPSQVLRRCKR